MTTNSQTMNPRQRGWLHWLLLGAWVCLCACGGASRMVAEPAAASAPAEQSPESDEIARLWAEIRDQQNRLGLDQASEAEMLAPSTAATSGESDAGADSASAESMSSTHSLGPDPDGVMAGIRDPDAVCPIVDNDDSRDAGAEAICADACTLGTSICDNAGRICVLASELGDDIWARVKCADAAAVCRRATERCCECRDS